MKRTAIESLLILLLALLLALIYNAVSPTGLKLAPPKSPQKGDAQPCRQLQHA